ncbi:hypothetical protein PBRA_001355, partial [Plasmodiophora brassicae]
MGYASDREVRGRSRSPGRPRRKEQYSLHVRNLDLSTTSEELRDLFGKHGSIRDVYIPRDYYSKQPRGFAYLEFTSKTEADAAIDALNGYSLNGRDLFVEYARGEHVPASSFAFSIAIAASSPPGVAFAAPSSPVALS